MPWIDYCCIKASIPIAQVLTYYNISLKRFQKII